MVNQTEGYKRNQLIALSIVLMLACLFISRAALSLSMIAFLVLTIVHNKILSQLKAFINNRFLVSVAILFFIPLISYFWSSNKVEWADIARIKFPLLFFPVAFAGSWQLKQKDWQRIGFAFVFIMFLATCWSFYQYFSEYDALNEAYLRSKTIRTPLEDDHVRFSWMVTCAVLCCVLLIRLKAGMKALLIFLASFFVIYLHVLSARMGLLSFYILLFVFGGWLLIEKRNKKLSFGLLAALVIMPLAAWFLAPTFRHRIQYFLYDISMVKNQQYVSGSNDGTRIQSLQAGWDVLRNNPLGVGAGDLKSTIFQWYEMNVPVMKEGEKFLPLSELLVYGGFAGWPAVLILTVVLLLPLFMKIRYRVFWIGLNIIIAFSFVFDITIEAQFGVFIYLIMALWWWKWFSFKTNE